MDASSGREQPVDDQDNTARADAQSGRSGEGSSALPQSAVPADEVGAAQISVDADCESQKSHPEMINGNDVDAASDAAHANVEMFSPDTSENMVTVICKTDNKGGEHEKEGGDGYETHSDSIETLEEDEESHAHQQKSDLTSTFDHMQLTEPTNEDVFDEHTVNVPQQKGKDDTKLTNNGETDKTRNDSETSSSSNPSRPESLLLPRPLQYYERKRSKTSSDTQPGPSQKVVSSGHQRSRSEAMDIEDSGRRLKGDLGCGDDIMSTSLPHGTILRKGEMIEFVADDLTEKIKRSSPMSSSRAGEFKKICCKTI
jgi:hypothetical protein